MLCDGFASVRYSTIGMRISAILVMVVGFAYGISLLFDPHDFVSDYIGFMKQGASATVLPICLMAMCLGRVRFRTFELVRRNPRDELGEKCYMAEHDVLHMRRIWWPRFCCHGICH